MRSNGGPKGKVMKHKLGQTEVVWDNLNPVFVKTFTVDYFFEETQDFRIEAYDMDDESKPNDLSAHDYIGCLDFKLGQVVTGRDQQLTAKMQAPKGAPQAIITAENVKRGGQTVIMMLHGQFNTGSEVFYIVWKQLSPGKWKPVYKSEAQVKQGGKHKFREAVLNTTLLGEENDEFRVDFMIAQSSGNHTLIGSDTATIAELQGGKNKLNIKGQLVSVEKFELKPVVSFLEYIFGGCQINLHVAVDFTASNGPQDQHDSLHNRNPARNQYL